MTQAILGENQQLGHLCIMVSQAHQELLAQLGGSRGLAAQEAAAEELTARGEASLPDLVAVMQSGEAEACLAAADIAAKLRRASTLRAAQAVSVVVEEMRAARSDGVRRAALRTLSALGAEAAAAAACVAGFLGEDMPPVLRCEASALLGRLGSAASTYLDVAVPMVAEELHSAEPLTQLAAARAVGCLGQSAAAHAGLACTLSANHLSDENPRVRQAALDALSEHGAAAAPYAAHMAALLDDDYVEVQCASAAALGGLGRASAAQTREACKVAAFAIQNPIPEVRVKAATALGRLGSAAEPFMRQACGVMVKELASKDRMLRMGAAQAIGVLGGSIALPHLAVANTVSAEALHDDSVLLRLEAAAALGRLHSVQEVTAQLAANVAVQEMAHDDPRARTAAARSLAALGPEAADFGHELAAMMVDGKAEVRQAAASALHAMGEHGLPHLAAATRNPDWKARSAAARALEAHGFARLPLSVTALRDS